MTSSGLTETNPLALYHHGIAMHGPGAYELRQTA
jgi:hypothetical protein